MNENKVDKTTKQWYHDLPSLTSDGIVLINSMETIIIVNPQMEKMLGYEPGTCMGQKLQDVCDKTLCDSIETSCTASPDEKCRFLEVPFFTRHGNRRYANIATAPVSLDNGTQTGTLAVVSDVTALHEAKRKLDHTNHKLHLISSITRHDILNKIETIRGYIGLLVRGMSDEKVSNRLHTIDYAAEEIRDILAFSREYEKMGLQDPAWFSVSESFFQAVNRFASHKEVTFHCENEGFCIFADPMFSRVFVNLIENSIVHGASVTTISVTCTVEEGHLCIRYYDNGIGVADEEKEHIFKRGVGSHHGLGLFLIRDILAITDITIWEEGIQHKGVCFVIHIPKGGYRMHDENINGDDTR